MRPARVGAPRVRNVPVPVAHVVGLVAGGVFERLQPWSLGVDATLALAIGGTSALVGLAVVAWSVLAAGRQRLAAPSALVTDGPYRYSRNPMYLGWTGLYLGIALAAGTAWPLALLPAVAVAVHREVRREERSLARRFGDDYRRYCHDVRRYL